MGTFSDNKTAIDNLYEKFLSHLIDKEEYLERIKQIGDSYDKEAKLSDKDVWMQSLYRRIFHVHERVILVNHLETIKLEVQKDSFLMGYMYPSLCTYLLLTCFDNLGQPSTGFIFFPDWVISKRKATEVDPILVKNENILDTSKKEYVSSIYRDYHKIYGMKNSFYRFINEIIPSFQRDNIFNNIIFEFLKDETHVQRFSLGTVREKKNWLFSTRNNYTHNHYSPEKHFRQLISLYGKDWEIREVLYEPTPRRVLLVDNFNEILKETIFVGIVEVIKSNSTI